ncbi:hypothetical protein [Pedobacter sp. UYP1]|uniref:hypothetical protein n=1 Tax=Pedobacter sp. UYP1 TaxID=1756396 RepID=UPI003398786F
MFFREPVIENSIVYTGGDTIPYVQLADIAESLSGEKFKRSVITISELDNDLKNDPNNFVKKYQHIFGNGSGVSWSLDQTFNFQKGIETMSAKNGRS